MQTLYRVRHECRLCRSTKLDVVVPLAPIPIATPNFRVSGASRDDALFREAVPLDLHLCRDCGLLQVMHVCNAHLLFENYVYRTSLSFGLSEHFRRAADEIVAAIAPPAGSLVVELGSNDGTLLKFFKAKGFGVQGCDPAKEIAQQATQKGIPTIANFFGAAVAREVKADRGPAAVVVANNMIANIDDPSDLVAGVREVLADDGVFVFETQYGLDVVVDNLLDTVYHEHLCYFYVRPLQTYLRRMGLELIDVVHIPTKGGSIRVFAQKAGGKRPVAAAAVGAAIVREEAIGLYGDDIYRDLVARISEIRRRLHTEIDKARATGRPIGGYGVSVGGTTLIEQFALGDKLDMMFDDDPDKDPILSGPAYDLPVFGASGVMDKNPALIVMFAWRYTAPILAKHAAWLKAGGVAAVPLPDLKLLR